MGKGRIEKAHSDPRQHRLRKNGRQIETAPNVGAPSEGNLKTSRPLGAKVNGGEPDGQIRHVWRPGHASETISHDCHGTLLARQPGRVRLGDCRLVVAPLV